MALRSTISLVKFLLERFDELKQAYAFHDESEEGYTHVDMLVMQIEDQVNTHVENGIKKPTTVDAYVAEMLRVIVFTHEDSSENVWNNFPANGCYEWKNEANIVADLHGLLDVLQGKCYSWTRGGMFTQRNMFLTSASMYVLSRFFNSMNAELSHVRERVSDLEFNERCGL